MLRAISAQWFELFVPRTMLARAVEVLAETRLVELDPVTDEGRPIRLDALGQDLERCRELQRRYGGHWPAPDCQRPRCDRLLEAILRQATATLEAWAGKAQPLIQDEEALARDERELERLRDLLDHLKGEPLDLGELAAKRPELGSSVFMIEPDAETPQLIRPRLYRRVDTPEQAYLVALGQPEVLRQIAESLGGRRARSLALPAWLEGGPENSLALTEERLGAVRDKLEAVRGRLRELNDELEIAAVRGDLVRVEWLVEHLRDVAVGGYLAQVTGWIRDRRDAERVREALANAQIPAALHFPAEPDDKVPPTITRNPFWAQPFELFGRLLGTPGRGEAEPSVLVAVIAPMLFGYMFGDVGQGAVLIAAGLWLRRRWPACGMLVSGGLFSVLFGWVFGSVFAMEGVIAPLWVHPMEAPVPLMVAPLFGGAALILLGMLLNGFEHHWQGRLREWIADEAGLMLFYAAAVLALFEPVMLVLAGLGLAWQAIGGAWTQRRHRGAALAHSLGSLPERLMQLAVNTLSFVRVGAFALAHAGLGHAAVSLAQAVDNIVLSGLVLVAGNLLILVVEGIVVAVQTTRLVLFEFFIRFLRTAGRPFEPLTPPAPP